MLYLSPPEVCEQPYRGSSRALTAVDETLNDENERRNCLKTARTLKDKRTGRLISKQRAGRYDHCPVKRRLLSWLQLCLQQPVAERDAVVVAD